MEIYDYHAILDLFIVFYGLTGLSSCLKMRRTHTLSHSRLVIPNGMSPDDCADPDGYLRYILPKAIVFSSLNLVCGGINLICVLFPEYFPSKLLSLTIPVFLVNLLAFGRLLSRSIKRFWHG